MPGTIQTEDNPHVLNGKTKRKYGPDDYFRITLTSEMAQGAIGRVHDAIIEVQTTDGRVHSCEAVVKIAFEPGQ